MIENMKLLSPSILLGIVLLFTSCGENVDPTKADLNLQMKAVTQLNTLNTSARVADVGIEFTEILVGVTEIELEGMDDSNEDGDHDDDDHNDGDHDNDNEIEFEGQFIVDLLNGTSDPDFGISDVIPGNYKELEIKISPILDDGNSISIKFNLAQEGTEPVKVELTTSKEFELEIEKEGGMQMDGNALNQLLVLFDLDKLFSEIDLSMVPADEDGIVRINENSNSDILSAIWSKIHHAFDAGEDNDNDDEIDDHHHSNDD